MAHLSADRASLCWGTSSGSPRSALSGLPFCAHPWALPHDTAFPPAGWAPGGARHLIPTPGPFTALTPEMHPCVITPGLSEPRWAPEAGPDAPLSRKSALGPLAHMVPFILSLRLHLRPLPVICIWAILSRTGN